MSLVLGIIQKTLWWVCLTVSFQELRKKHYFMGVSYNLVYKLGDFMCRHWRCIEISVD